MTSRTLNDAQKQRIDSHIPTINVTDGDVFVTVETVVNPNNQTKKVKTVKIAPQGDERVDSIENSLCKFDDLQHMNVILTNACNLKCTYCYEQHNQDYGRFDTTKLKKMYDFLLGANANEGKIFQFFGGEPLIHKKLILDFLAQYSTELESNKQYQKIGCITNGVLLTPDLVNAYFSYDFVSMSISLDTTNANTDHRELKQKDIDRIIEMISLIPQYHKDSHNVSIRCTISRETAPHLKKFITDLYEAGVRAMVIHPLTMSSVNGFINWPADEWKLLRDDITWAISSLPNFTIQFSEGVGMKGGSNCLVGSDMIAVDASGDFSGCYFFTNQKMTAGHTILGNILDGTIYSDRYVNFQEAYNKLFEHEECKACDLKGYCYQCPAGNLDTGPDLFRPDGMCKDIVRLFLELQEDITKKAFNMKYSSIMSSLDSMTEQDVYAKAMVHLMYKYVTETHVPNVDVKLLPDCGLVAGYFLSVAENDTRELPTLDQLAAEVTRVNRTTTIKELYEYVADKKGIPTDRSKEKSNDMDKIKNVFYLTMLHLIVLNEKGDKLKKVYVEQYK